MLRILAALALLVCYAGFAAEADPARTVPADQPADPRVALLKHLPAGSRAIDAFVGEPDMIGRGHGSVFLRLVAERLKVEGAPVVAIDPDADNARARRAYEKAGFRGDAIVQAGEGPEILMTFDGAV